MELSRLQELIDKARKLWYEGYDILTALKIAEEEYEEGICDTYKMQ